MSSQNIFHQLAIKMALYQKNDLTCSEPSFSEN
uniref:Uncharacterized protein n=1 Tax=Arundo donax TaxID=35708 RepID=A0A0A9C706_ARUDO